VRHVRPEQWALIELLAADLGALERVSGYLPSPDSVAELTADPLVELSQVSVGLYSLTESALRQVKRILEKQYPGVKVSLNSDLVGTTRLKQLARQSDLFVMATASAKHAATEFIDANRPTSLPTLRAAGKGAASMIAALRNHFLGTSATVSR
jgi:hypothetical protein